MKVLITGVNGFIGQHWVRALHRIGAEVVATGRGNERFPSALRSRYYDLDITDGGAVQSLLTAERPTAILHAAAISKPDVCVQDTAQADLVNITGTQHLLKAAESLGCYCCFLSTDFVFDGEKGMYTETDEPAPINYYGLTKWRAEQMVQQYAHGWSIVRTVTVYGQPVEGRPNILSTVVDKLQRGEVYTVFDDQVRTPTYAGDLAWGVAKLIQGSHPGIFHLSGEEILTPFQMAIRTAEYLGLDPSLLTRVTAETFQQPAKRPLRTGFVVEKAQKTIGYAPCSFDKGLRLSFPRP